MSEDSLDLLVEIEISDFERINWASKGVLEHLVLSGGQLYLLGVKSGPEFSGLDGTLSERVVILKEFTESDSMSFYLVSDLLHKVLYSLGSSEVNIMLDIGRLGTGIWMIDNISQNITVLEEWEVFDISEFISISSDDRGKLLSVHINTKKSDSLLELLWRYLEVIMSILILEEGFGIKSLSVDEELEFLDNLGDISSIAIVSLLLSIETLSSGIIERDINGSLKILLGEDLIDAITKVFPSDMGTLFWCLEFLGESLELSTRKYNFTHVEANSKLSFSNITRS